MEQPDSESYNIWFTRVWEVIYKDGSRRRIVLNEIQSIAGFMLEHGVKEANAIVPTDVAILCF
jgi:hypothetical protein